MPIGTDLVMHEECEPEQVRNQGAALGRVVERAARRWATPLAIPLMDLRLEKTQLVLPRVHDCIGLLMGSHRAYQDYFENHPGVYYRSPGWIEFQTPGMMLEPAFASQKSPLGERRTLAELTAQYGEENGVYLFEQFNAFRRHYSGLTYISTAVASDDPSRVKARAEAEKEGWAFDEVKGTLDLLQHLVNGEWDPSSFLVVPPGTTIRATLGDKIVEAE